MPVGRVPRWPRGCETLSEAVVIGFVTLFHVRRGGPLPAGPGQPRRRGASLNLLGPLGLFVEGNPRFVGGSNFGLGARAGFKLNF